MTDWEPDTALGAEELASLGTKLRCRADALVDQQAAAILEQVPAYKRLVPTEDLAASTLRNVERVLTTLREARPPRPEQIHEAWVARERVKQGVPGDDMVNAYRLCHRILGDAMIKQAAAVGVSPVTSVRTARLLWETADVATARLVSVRREAELEYNRHDASSRLAFLRSLVFGSLPSSEMATQGAAYGLIADRTYYAVRARPNADTSSEQLQRAIEASGRTDVIPVFAGIIEGDVVAVTPVRPQLDNLPVSAGLGGPADLHELETAFQMASRMLHVAIRFGRTGAVGLLDLSIRLAVASEVDLGAALVDRYLRPLDTEGEFGELLVDTVRQYLENGQRVVATARRMGVHPNTLRHRLDRFERLTGTSLNHPLAVLEVWWAIERRRLGDSLRPE